MEHLCQAGPVAGAPIDPPPLPWSVYAYGPDGFAWEHPIGHNINVMGYPFPDGTRADKFSFILPLLFSHLSTLILTLYSKQLYGDEDVDGDNDDDDYDGDDGSDGCGGSKSTPSHRLGKRHFR